MKKPPKLYKVTRRPLGKLVLPPALDQLATFVGAQAEMSLGWFAGVHIDRLTGPLAKAAPTTLKDVAITLLALSNGGCVVALATGATPIVHLDPRGVARLLAPSLAAFVQAWSRCATSVPDLDHDGPRIIKVEKRNHAIWANAPSARPALAAWAKARRFVPPRGESFDLPAFLGDALAVVASDPRRLPHDVKLEAALPAGKPADFAKYGAWLTQQGHPLGAVITADAAAEKKRAFAAGAAKRFDAYVEANLAPRYARIATNFWHFSRPDFRFGTSFKYGFLRVLETAEWTATMREQVLEFLEQDDHARWLIKLDPQGLKLGDLSILSRFPALRTLTLRKAKVAGAKALAPLAALTQLRALDLTDSQITDLTPLAKLPLIQLTLTRTAVADLRPLAGHPTLEHLELGGTKVKDITPLLSCKRLCNVGLWDARVAKADAEKLIASMKKNGARPIANQDDLLVGYDRYVSHNTASW
ncbi:MAG: hypothetical protein R3B06_12570 [Kofleriaceae bacterium]